MIYTFTVGISDETLREISILIYSFFNFFMLSQISIEKLSSQRTAVRSNITVLSKS